MKTTAGARPVPEVLRWSRNLVDPALRAAVDRLPGTVRLISGYHFGWWDAAGRPTAADGGKALRPALALLAAQSTGADAEVALPAAVAVELVHNFSLLHDDVMDGDTVRRHRPAAWTVFGAGPAILTGDALVTLALDLLATSGLPNARLALRALSDAVIDLIRGQAEDLAFESRDDVRPAECVRMAEGKTGALLATSCALGGFAAGADPARVELLGRFGAAVGLAFQHVDDLLGIWGDPVVTGKPVHSDLRNRKKSLPVVAALGSPCAAGRELADLYARPASLSDVDAARAAALVDAAGGRRWSRQEADRLLAHALDQLANLDPAGGAGAELAALGHLVVGRTH
ncbi:family 2 encapsulin nanocompartment cargo protein polyprenyl transferase [Kibdelosporangium phytohabitans]|uniref:Dimethylallyltranstransferase n=1 Tax=Kibdelosporangium phytohabitans TaxID=860235 RepID=A0A0N9I2L9_9PSEU|nr:family 2 encapsulin nanocompartment cargo protein polyprenyl transferase [Kibdelosporangium phytohabitans]ALG08459.1 dimethylallyltranstransferase [Kibdelosporangium phytohabitans]MBE1470480.1 geranylgeranyl diphosphate synthase type I [Kibdelosporangium phytohabitans]